MAILRALNNQTAWEPNFEQFPKSKLRTAIYRIDKRIVKFPCQRINPGFKFMPHARTDTYAAGMPVAILVMLLFDCI